MSFWNRPKHDTPAEPPPPVIVVPELDELAELIPERNSKGVFFWQPYVDRIVERFDGLPAPEGGESFVRTCLATGCKAVPVMRRHALWENQQPGPWDKQGRAVFEMRVRLGLFFAASLRYLVHGLYRLRITVDKVDWHPWLVGLQAGEVRWQPAMGGGVSFRAFRAACDGVPQITWLEATPSHAQVCALAPRFLQAYEMQLLTLELAVEVLACAQPGVPGGLFGYMLFDDGQLETERVDVAGLFLEALWQLVRSGRLRVNTRPGDLFVTPEVSFLVAPGAVDVLIGVLRKRGHSFTRPDIYRALGEGGFLVGIGPGAKRHTPLAKLKSPAWRAPVRVRGLPIAHAALWKLYRPPAFFDGTIKVESGP